MYPEIRMHLSADSSPRIDPVDVLVVSARSHCVPIVREELSRWPVQVRVRWTSDPIDALRLALAEPPSLAIVDARLDRAGGRALIGQLARWRAELEVFAFEEPADSITPSGPSTWHWRELPMVLRWWAKRHLPGHEIASPSEHAS
jgi:hypothetical protein